MSSPDTDRALGSAAGHKMIPAADLAQLRAERTEADATLDRLRANAEATSLYTEYDEADYDDAFAARDMLRELLA